MYNSIVLEILQFNIKNKIQVLFNSFFQNSLINELQIDHIFFEIEFKFEIRNFYFCVQVPVRQKKTEFFEFEPGKSLHSKFVSKFLIFIQETVSIKKKVLTVTDFAWES